MIAGVAVGIIIVVVIILIVVVILMMKKKKSASTGGTSNFETNEMDTTESYIDNDLEAWTEINTMTQVQEWTSAGINAEGELLEYNFEEMLVF